MDVEMMDMFPACAGMNRSSKAKSATSPHVPRVRGDEPIYPPK